jgi:hypothetical protein
LYDRSNIIVFKKKIKAPEVTKHLNSFSIEVVRVSRSSKAGTFVQVQENNHRQVERLRTHLNAVTGYVLWFDEWEFNLKEKESKKRKHEESFNGANKKRKK